MPGARLTEITERENLEGDMAVEDSQSANHDTKSSLGSGPTHSEDGIDLTLIRWMLSLTPAERLQVLQQSVQSLLRLRDDKAHR
jgi:hypothetical protein